MDAQLAEEPVQIYHDATDFEGQEEKLLLLNKQNAISDSNTKKYMDREVSELVNEDFKLIFDENPELFKDVDEISEIIKEHFKIDERKNIRIEELEKKFSNKQNQ